MLGPGRRDPGPTRAVIAARVRVATFWSRRSSAAAGPKCEPARTVRPRSDEDLQRNRGCPGRRDRGWGLQGLHRL